jgi:hypothetical protein
MDRTEESRLAWQKAQADLQSSLADLEKAVAAVADPAHIQLARKAVADRQRIADELLQRHITQLGKS